MQFQVPQFLDVEDKIVGPLTIKQFLYLAGGLGLAYLSYRFVSQFSGFLGGLVGLSFIVLGGALAFYKYNNKPFIFLIESAFYYIQSTRLYIWKRKERQAETNLNLNNFQATKHTANPSMKSISSKLSDLAWSMDVPPEEAAAQKRADQLGL